MSSFFIVQHIQMDLKQTNQLKKLTLINQQFLILKYLQLLCILLYQLFAFLLCL
jgi:hypothetical protein